MASSSPGWGQPSGRARTGAPPPRSSFKTHTSPLKPLQDSLRVQMSLISVNGNTTSSTSGFDYQARSDGTSSFALCAGSVAVVGTLDQQGNVSRRYFRAHPNLAPSKKSSSLGIAPALPRTPESRRRAAHSVYDDGHAFGSPSSEQGETLKKGGIRLGPSAFTSLTLSKDGRLLAAGETGHNPKILIFSLSEDSPTKTPLVALSEHTIGIRCLAFSDDSRWLCSVGDIHDGYIFLWSINPRTGHARLHSSNKCTSHVNDVAWMGLSAISVGIRHVKVWRFDTERPGSPSKSPLKSVFKIDAANSARPPSPVPKTFPGKNSLLGILIDATFNCVASLSLTKAVLGSDKGDVCVLDDSDGLQTLFLASHLDFSILSVNFNFEENVIYLGGGGGSVKPLRYGELHDSMVLSTSIRPCDRQPWSGNGTASDKPSIIALGSSLDRLLTIGSDHVITIQDTAGRRNSFTLDAHDSPVQSIEILQQPNLQQSDFFTWTTTCVLKFWTIDGVCTKTMVVPSESPQQGYNQAGDELKAVGVSQDANIFLLGYQSGMLRLMQDTEQEGATLVRAHNGEITSIAVYYRESSGSLVASCSRDRTIQLFRWGSNQLSLLQTMVQAGAISEVRFFENGATSMLLSSSSDRTITVRVQATMGDSIAYLQTKIITLRASPLSMAVIPRSNGTLIVSAMDRQIHEYGLTSGLHKRSMRIADNDSNEVFNMSSLSVHDINVYGKKIMLVVGTTTTDKSVRVYDYESSTLLEKQYGHTEGISKIAAIDNTWDEKTLRMVTTGLDGTIMIWQILAGLITHESSSFDLDNGTPVDHSQISRRPLRRMLSESTLSSFQTPQHTSSNPLAIYPRHPSPSASCVRNGSLRPRFGSPAAKAMPIMAPSTTQATVCRYIQHDSADGSASRHPLTCRSRETLMDTRERTKSMDNLRSGGLSSEFVCKTLRAYRECLSASSRIRNSEPYELINELRLTIEAVNMDGGY